METQNRLRAKVHVHSRYRGRTYYEIAIPWRVAGQYAGKFLNVDVVLPSGETVGLKATRLVLTGGRVAIRVPAEYSAKFDGVKEVDVVIKPLKLVEETS